MTYKFNDKYLKSGMSESEVVLLSVLWELSDASINSNPSESGSVWDNNAEIAEILCWNRQKVGRILNTLISRGIVYKQMINERGAVFRMLTINKEYYVEQ